MIRQPCLYLLTTNQGDHSDEGDGGNQGNRGDEGDQGDQGYEIKQGGQGEVSTIILGMLESSGFRKHSTLLVIQLLSRRLYLCHCLCICVPYSFLNS